MTGLATPDVELSADLVYSHAGGRPRLLDLYLPRHSTRPLPVIVWLHAGGWRSGDRKQAPDLSRHFAAHGFAMASIDYRLSREATFPAQLHDVKAAIRWLRTNTERLGLDGRRIGLWGASAGGHLATLAALTPDSASEPAELGSESVGSESVGSESVGSESVGSESVDSDPNAAADVQCVVTAYAPMDFLVMDAQRDAAKIEVDDPSAFVLPPGARTGDARSYESLLIGAPIHDRPDLAHAASPLGYVTADAPPFLIVHGRSDRAVPAQQSVMLHRALVRVGAEVTLHLIDGRGHGFLDRADTAPALTLSVIEAFFRRHLTDTTFDRPASDGAP
ncbi:MAG TPA: alpha/beta hydrolase [Gemmatimonadaceae bacterium]